jgi:outer membrane lipoprotein carrier protein
MKKIAVFISFFIMGVWSFALYAKTATADLAERLSIYNTVQGNFAQTITDSKGMMLQSSSGTFTVKSPGYFYWYTSDPFSQLVVANLKNVWLYDPDLAQVTIRPYSGSVDQSPALLLSGDVQKITQHYSVKIIESPVYSFVLTPKAKDSNFTELRLIFSGKILTNMILKDSLEQTTTFTFENTQINQAVDAKIFEFEPPVGVDIIKNEQ